MTDYPETLRYAKSHEWSHEENNIVTVGISEYAQQELGDLVYVELPEQGSKVTAGEQCAVVESVKTASDLYSPVSGTVLQVNEALNETPELINDEPYKAWIFKIETDNLNPLQDLMDAQSYQKFIVK